MPTDNNLQSQNQFEPGSQATAENQAVNSQPQTIDRQAKNTGTQTNPAKFLILGLLIVLVVGAVLAMNKPQRRSINTAQPNKAQDLSASKGATAPYAEAADIEGERSQFPEFGLSMQIPDNWTAKKEGDQDMLTISKGDCSLVIVRNPQTTGGGAGFAFDGVELDELDITTRTLKIDGKIYTKITQYLTTLPDQFKEGVPQDQQQLEQIFGNALVKNAGTSSNEFPRVEVEVGGEKRTYSISYEHASQKTDDAGSTTYNYVSVENPQFQQTMSEMDGIVQTIKFE